MEQMLRDDIIVPSTSPWNSPILVVPKKAKASGVKKWRNEVVFRKLNDVTIDEFSLPIDFGSFRRTGKLKILFDQRLREWLPQNFS
jgi:hypothetical protein